MPDRKTDPPSLPTPKRGTGAGGRLKPDQYELKIRWEKARRVVNVSSQGVGFEFDSPLKVGVRYPISLSAPGVSFSSTLEVTRCRLTVQPEGRYFQIEGKFFPYVE
jgi:hypothetical protein